MPYCGMNLLAFGLPGWPEVVLIILLVLFFFGAKRIPELTKSFLSSAREFRSALNDADPAAPSSKAPVTEVVNSAPSSPAPSSPAQPSVSAQQS